MANETLSEVLFEFIQQGRYVKVVAMDPVSRVEVTVVGDRAATKDTLKRIAINKLRYVLNRNNSQPNVPPPRR